MPTPKTNRELVKKGIIQMVSTVTLLFLGPIVIHSSFKNQDHPLFIPVLGVGILLCLSALFFAIRGLRTIMRALFNDPS